MRILFLCIVLSAQTLGDESPTAESLHASTAQILGFESTPAESLSASTAQILGFESTPAESLSASTAHILGVESSTAESPSASTAEMHTSEGITTASPSPLTAETHSSESITTDSPSTLTEEESESIISANPSPWPAETHRREGITTDSPSTLTAEMHTSEGITTASPSPSTAETYTSESITTASPSTSTELTSVVQSSTAIPQLNTTVKEGPVSRPHFNYTIQKEEKNRISVTFSCISETGSLPITYRMFQNVSTLVKEQKVFEPAPFHYKMFVNPSMGPSVYKCKAQNTFGVMYSQEINIGPVSKPHFNYTIQMDGNGASINFFCISAAGSLPITYRIFQSKTTLVNEQTVKESSPFQCKMLVTPPMDSIEYSCKAKNILGVAYSQIQKIKIDKPASETSKIVFYSSTALLMLLLIILPCSCVCIILICKCRKTHL